MSESLGGISSAIKKLTEATSPVLTSERHDRKREELLGLIDKESKKKTFPPTYPASYGQR